MEGLENHEKIPEIQVGIALPEDAAGINDVQKETWIATYPNEEYGITREDVEGKDWSNPERLERRRKAIEESGENLRLWTAKRVNRVVAFCILSRDGDRNQLRAIYVLPECQGTGVGTKLMQEALAYADPKKETFVEAAKYNTKAIDFYKSFGFEGEEEIKTPPDIADLPSGRTIPEIRMVRKADQENL